MLRQKKRMEAGGTPERFAAYTNGGGDLVRVDDNTPQGGSMPGGQKSRKLFSVGLVAAAVAALGIGGGLMFFARSPETVVYTALDNTAAYLEERNNGLRASIPYWEAMYRQREASGVRADFTFTPDKITTTSSFVDAALGLILEDMGVSGSYVIDTSKQVAKLEAAVDVQQERFISAQMEISPDQLSLALPELTDTVFAITPNRFAQEYQNGVFMTYYAMSPEELAYEQEILVGQINSFFSAQNIDLKRMLTDCKDILLNVVADAEFARVGSTGSETVYTVTLQGDKVRQAFLDLAAYWYLESPSGKAAAVLSDGYQVIVEEQILTRLAQTIPQMPTVVELHIDKSQVIRWANAELSFLPDPITGIKPDWKNVTLDFGLDEQGQMSMQCHILHEDDFLGETYTMVECRETIADGAYLVTGGFLLNSVLMQMEIRLDQQMTAQGGLDYVVEFIAGDGSYDMDMTVGMDAQVTLTEQGYKMDMQDVSMALLSTDTYMQLGFQATAAVEPAQPEDVALRTDVTPLLTLTEEAYLQEMEQLSHALEKFLGDF